VSPLAWVALVVAGALGASVRYLVDIAITERTRSPLPWGTLVINVTGSFVLGVVTGLALYHGFPKNVRVVIGVGFCGAYTTFSTFTFETVRLLEEGDAVEAIKNVTGTFLAAGLAAAAGLALAAIGS
jgi:fluoride exporter